MSPQRRKILTFLVALATASGTAGCGQAQQSTADVAGLAPDFELENFAGGKARLSDYRGKVVLLNFWATWCPPCLKEIPDFVELYRELEDDGLVILGVSLDGNPRQVLPRFIKKYQVNYPILLGDNRVARDYGGITGIPTTFLIDREGKIRQRYVGLRPRNVFEATIKDLLGAGATEPGQIGTDG